MKLSQIAKDDSFSAIKFCEIKKLHAVMLSTCHSHILWYETFFKSWPLVKICESFVLMKAGGLEYGTVNCTYQGGSISSCDGKMYV